MIGAIVGAGASLIGGMMASDSQESANNANLEQARANNALQLESAKNKYQWTVEDMEKAGLNPMLAYSQGAQGIGGLSQADIKPVTGMAEGVGSAGQAFNKMIANQQVRAQTENIQADSRNKDATTANIAANTVLQLKLADKAEQDRLTGAASAAQSQSQVELNKSIASEISARIDLLVKQGRLTDAQASVARANIPVLAVMPSVYRQQISESKTRSLSQLSDVQLKTLDQDLVRMSRAKAGAYQDFYESSFGKGSPYWESLFGGSGTSSAVNAASFARLLR